MSNKNYDVELSITYDNTYRHYIPTYKVAIPRYYYETHPSSTGPWIYVNANYEGYVSFDDGSETQLATKYHSSDGVQPPNPYWFTNVPESGVFSKVYFRNPYRDKVTFNSSNCFVQALYNIKAAFEIQWNATGFASNTNPKFKLSTVQKNTYKQYGWKSAVVYYRKKGTSTYQSVVATIEGTWSDYTISTDGVTLEDGYIYQVYVRATADDNSVKNSAVAEFTTTDADAVATCISPSGIFTSGDVTFVWSHSTAYGTTQYAYDLEYSNDNGSTWTTVASHVVSPQNTDTVTLTDAGVYVWRVRTYNSNDVAGEWAEATFVNNAEAVPPTTVSVSTGGRPTVSWASTSQSAYQVQFLLGDSIVYDSGAVYSASTDHFVNKYFDDNRSYVVRVRIYNALGEISEWSTTGYQQPSVDDVVFEISGTNGATITITEDEAFEKYYLLRDNKLIAEIVDGVYTDPFAVGLTNYSVVGVTALDQSDIQSLGYRVAYEHASIVAQNRQVFEINKRVDAVYEVKTSNEADINKVSFIGDETPTHYASDMRLKSFTISCFDEQGIAEGLLGTIVFYADNFGNGGFCMVKAYEKTDNFVKNSRGAYANEVLLTLEVTSYDDSIEYPI